MVCMDGRTCPAGTTCDDAHGQCLTPDQLTVRIGMMEGSRCNIAGAPVGTGRDGVCLHDVCGDDYVSVDETCDGQPAASCLGFGFQIGVLGCSAYCGLDLTSCDRFGWTPLIPTGLTPISYSGVWGSSATDVFIVG